jgi:hypothetical protein
LLKKDAAIRRLKLLLEDKDLELDIVRGDLDQLKLQSDQQLQISRQEKNQMLKQLQSLQCNFYLIRRVKIDFFS